MNRNWQVAEHFFGVALIGIVFTMAIAGVWTLSPIAKAKDSQLVAGNFTGNGGGAQIVSNLIPLTLIDLRPETNTFTQLAKRTNQNYVLASQFTSLPNRAYQVGKLQVQNKNLMPVEVSLQVELPNDLVNVIAYVEANGQTVQLSSQATKQVGKLIVPSETAQTWSFYLLSDREVFFAETVRWSIDY